MSIKDREKRRDNAQKNLDDFRSMLQVAYDYCIPEKNTFRIQSPGKEENIHIFDHTAVNGIVTAANRIQGALYPPQQQWMDFAAGNNFGEEEVKEIDDALTEATKVFFSYLHQSNFDTEVSPSTQDCLISTGYIQIDEEPITSDIPFRFTSIASSEIAPEKGAKGIIENCHRKIEMECGHIEETWPNANIPDKLAEIIRKDRFCKVEVKISQIKEGNSYWLYVDWEKEELFKEERGYKFIIPFRESVMPNEVLGRGPILRLLPVIRRVNKVQEFMLQNAAMNITGIFTGRGDGDFNPYSVRLVPGAVIPVDSNDNANPTLRALDRVGDPMLGDMIISDMQAIIEKALYINPLGDITDPVRSATEQMIRQQEQLRNQGAAIGRLKTEFLNEVIKSVSAILVSRGKLPKEFKIDGRDIKVVYQSPLAKAEMLDDFQNMTTFIGTMQSIAQTLPPEAAASFVAGTIAVEDLPAGIAKMLGVDSNFVRSEEDRVKLAEVAGSVQREEPPQ